MYDCRRDLDDIGFSEIPVGKIRGIDGIADESARFSVRNRDRPQDVRVGRVVENRNRRFTEGVLFLTYSTLISKRSGSANSVSKYGSAFVDKIARAFGSCFAGATRNRSTACWSSTSATTRRRAPNRPAAARRRSPPPPPRRPPRRRSR